MNKVLIKIVIIKIVMISYVAVLSTKEMKRNYFYKAHTSIQEIYNKLFIILNLNHNFTSNQKNRLLLTLHAAMKTIAERNFETYKHIKTAVKLDKKRKPKDALFDLNKLVNILITENLVPDHNIILFSKPTNNSRFHLKISSLDIPEKSEESFAFLKEYFSNSDKAELLTDINFPLNKIKNTFIKKMRNLKKWGASKNTGAVSHSINDTRRIFHGRSVSIENYPFVASIHVMAEFVCSGSIIKRGMIITAATCVQIAYKNNRFLQDNKGGIVVRIGSNYIQRSGTLCFVYKIFFHPDFDPVNLRHNLAILKFSNKEHSSFNKVKIRRIEYQYVRGLLPKNIKSVSVLGWGDKDAQPVNVFGRLSIADIDIYDLENCKNAYSSKFVTDENFCAGFETIGSGACHRDVGGPAIFNSKLVGVVSFGPPSCGMPNAPTTFTNLGQYIDWIDSIVPLKPANQTENEEITTTSFPTQAMYQQQLNVLPSVDITSRLNKKLQKFRTKTNPDNIQILDHLLEILLKNKDVSDPSYNYKNKKKEKHSGELNLDQNEPHQKIQIGFSSHKTKHGSNLPKIEKVKNNNLKNSYDKFSYNQQPKIINPKIKKSPTTFKDLFHRTYKNLKGFLGLSDIIDKKNVYLKKGEDSIDSNSNLKYEQRVDEFYTTSATDPVKYHLNLDLIPEVIWQKNDIIGVQQTKSSNVYNNVIKPVTRYKYLDSNETDNYESGPDNVMSLEIPSEIPLAQAVAVIMSTTNSIAIQKKLISRHKPLIHPKKKQMKNSLRFSIKQKYPLSVSSTHGKKLFKKMVFTPVKAMSSVAMAPLQETTTSVALVKIPNTSEEKNVLELADMAVALMEPMPLASYEYDHQYIGKDEYEDYNRMLSELIDKEI